ncbi:spore coat protein U domain-containing protein [Undibacterium sp. TJN25]|uniref:spore coat protein U domain-containing protein n=1 Tax=Undibacterium sp. TJN25 TaxID=3413056 RepID=UPI003BEFBC15
MKHVAIAASALCAVQTLHAANVSTTMTNTVTVTNNCTVSTTGFTTIYDPLNTNATANQDVSASVTTSCSLAAPAVITLSQGANAASGSSDASPLRRLSNGAATPAYLSYSLYQDAGRSTTWGNTALTGVPHVGTGSGATTNVYARIPSGQTPGVTGTFTDSVMVTVTY